MESIHTLNEAYRELFKRERLELVTRMEIEKVEILEALKITNVYWEDLYTDDECYYIQMDLNGQKITYYSGYEEDDFSFNLNGEWIDFSADEYKMFEKWWEELNMTQQIEVIYTERVQQTCDAAVKSKMKMTIEDISIEGREVVYTLSNGEKIRQQVDRKGEENE